MPAGGKYLQRKSQQFTRNIARESRHDKFVKVKNRTVTLGETMYLLTEWEGRTGKYLARGPYVLTESQIFSPPARPYSVNKHFII